MTATPGPAVAARNISKRYGGVRALADVSLDDLAGDRPCAAGRERRRQEHARQGPCGRGATGRGRGAHRRAPRSRSPRPRRRGAAASPSSTRSSASSRSCTSSPTSMPAARITAALGWMHERRDARRARPARSADIGWSIPLDREVGSLTLAEQQMVEIVRAFHFKADLVLLDEPNSSFTETEIEGALRRRPPLPGARPGLPPRLAPPRRGRSRSPTT